jgi:hypothetical protein
MNQFYLETRTSNGSQVTELLTYILQGILGGIP